MVESLTGKGLQPDDIISKIDWNKSPYSLVVNGKRNVPIEKWEMLIKVFNIENPLTAFSTQGSFAKETTIHKLGSDLQLPIDDSTLTFHEKLRQTKLFMKYEPIPSYDIDIAAANSENQEMFDDKSMRAEDYYFIPEFSGCRAFNVYSDSMEPKIQKGSKIFARRVEDWAEVLEPGQVYAVGLHDGRRFLKIINFNKKNPNEFILVSANPAYGDFPVNKSKIRSIWLIDGWMNKSTQSTYFVLKGKNKT